MGHHVLMTESVEEQAVFTGGPVTPLNLPCSFTQLVDWVDHVAAAQRPGSTATNVVSASATSITVS